MWLHLLLLAEIRSSRMRKRRAPRTSITHGCCRRLGTRDGGDAGGRLWGWVVIRPKRIYFPEHFCYCFSSNLCVLNTTNSD
jgi:hypothetical protein